MKKFELPYNFNLDSEYFRYLDINKDKLFNVDNVYLPCFNPDIKGNIINTRQNEMHVPYPNTIKEYEIHLNLLKRYNLNLNILIQRNASIDTIESYMNNYGINTFTINDDSLAIQLKEKYGSDIHLILSVTRKLSYEELLKNDYSMYDNIVLFFWFNRHLNELKNLNNKNNYILLVDCFCLYNCQMAEKHWFDNFNTLKYCVKQKFNKDRSLNMNNSCYIRPEDIYLFDDYVSLYKIDGRERRSDEIFSAFNKYLNGVKTNNIQLSNFDLSNIESNYLLNT